MQQLWLLETERLYSYLADDGTLKSGRRKVQMEEMTYVRGKNDLNRHIRYGNSEQLNFLK